MAVWKIPWRLRWSAGPKYLLRKVEYTGCSGVKQGHTSSQWVGRWSELAQSMKRFCFPGKACWAIFTSLSWRPALGLQVGKLVANIASMGNRTFDCMDRRQSAKALEPWGWPPIRVASPYTLFRLCRTKKFCESRVQSWAQSKSGRNTVLLTFLYVSVSIYIYIHR